MSFDRAGGAAGARAASRAPAQPDARSPVAQVGRALLGVGILVGLAVVSRFNYLLFHSLAEVFGVVIASGIFMLAWSTRRLLSNDFLLVVGIGLLFTAAVQVLHMLAYLGMGILPEGGGDLATKLWLVGRFLVAGSFLLAPVFLDRRLDRSMAFAGYVVVVGLLLASIFVWDVFPTAFVEGAGLTRFKVAVELTVAALLGVAIALLVRRRALFDREVLRLLVVALGLSIAAGLAFTLYVDVYGIANVVGHLLAIASFFHIYRAIIETGVAQPHRVLFRELQREAERLELRVAERTAALHESGDRLRELSHRLVEAQEKERQTIARELHDEAGQGLTAVMIGLGLLERGAGGAQRGQIEELKRTVASVMEGLHRLSANLRPATLDRLGLVRAVEQHVASVRNDSGLAIDVAATGLDGERLPPEVEVTVYRLVQESLTNVVRHSRAARVGVLLARNAGQMVAAVEDDGVGFDPEQAARSGRLGLVGMRERVELLSGSLEISSAPGRGCAVTARIPLR